MNDYYVYCLKHPKTDIPFYIGKGLHESRMYRHEEDTIRGSVPHGNKLLFNKITKVLRECGEIKYEKIQDGLSEESALQLETFEILKYGRRDNKTGILCNLTNGGEGVSGLKHSAKSKKLMSDSYNSGERVNISIDNFKLASASNVGVRKLSPRRDEIITLYDTMTLKELCIFLNSSYSTVKNYLTELGIYIPNKNRRMSEEDKRKRLGREPRAVNQYDINGNFIKTHKSISAACVDIGKIPITKGNIGGCCRQQQNSAYGYKWRYTDAVPKV